MTLDLSNAQPGGVITVKLDKHDAANLRLKVPPSISLNQILSYEPPAFSWDQVKPGMAFSCYGDIVGWFVGFTFKNVVVLENGEGDLSRWDRKALTRAPEHDERDGGCGHPVSANMPSAPVLPAGMDKIREIIASGWHGWFGDEDPDGDRENVYMIPLDQFERLEQIISAYPSPQTSGPVMYTDGEMNREESGAYPHSSAKIIREAAQAYMRLVPVAQKMADALDEAKGHGLYLHECAKSWETNEVRRIDGLMDKALAEYEAVMGERK